MTSLATAPWLAWPQTQRLTAALGADNLRFVGGAVRDTLLGLPVADIDIATLYVPTEIIARLKAAGIKAVPTGIDHGTITAVVDGLPFEVTTLRRDVETDGRRAVVAFSTEWREDAARRDFTFSALYMNMYGELFDYFGGLDDLMARRVRFIGDALTRIREDGLRILRFFRFHARFGAGPPDADGLAACIARVNDLMALSRERVRDEVLKLLAAADPVPTVALMIEAGIFAPVLPEITSADRLGRLVTTERAVGDVAPLRRLAALLPNECAALQDVGHRLKLSKAMMKRLVALAGPAFAGLHTEQEARVAIYRDGSQAFIDRVIADPQVEDPARWVAYAQGWQLPNLPVSGQHFVNRGLPVGPAISAAVRAFEQAWIGADFPTDSDMINQIIETVCKGNVLPGSA